MGWVRTPHEYSRPPQIRHHFPERALLMRHVTNAVSALVVLLFVSLQVSNAQLTRQWVARYSGLKANFDGTTAIVIDDSANAIMTGYSTRSTSGYDVVTIKYAPDG